MGCQHIEESSKIPPEQVSVLQESKENIRKSSDMDVVQNSKDEVPSHVQKFVDFPAEDFNRTISPKDNLYEFANGGWLERTKIPDDKKQWGTLYAMHADNLNGLSTTIEKMIREGNPYEKDSDAWNAVELYALGNDTQRRDNLSKQPLEDRLKQIDSISTLEDLQKFIAETNFFTEAIWNVHVAVDAKENTKYSLQLSESTPILKVKDFYEMEEDSPFVSGYRDYVSALFSYIGNDTEDSLKKAKNVFALEQKMVKKGFSRAEQYDPEKTYNQMTINQIQELTPSIDWTSFFNDVGVKSDVIVVSNPEYNKNIETMLSEVPLETWKEYLQIRLVHASAKYIDSSIEEKYYNLFGKIFGGMKEMPSNGERILTHHLLSFGDPFSQIYIAEKFPPEVKELADTMIDYILLAYKNRILQNTWLSDETKEKAVQKLSNVRRLVGYPEEWKEYPGLKIISAKEGGSYIDSVIAIAKANKIREFGMLKKPVNYEEWEYPAHLVNAAYFPEKNLILFPAAVLQPPLFDINADPARNFGAMGAIIGHEITHGFDELGSKYDENGSFQEWWTDEDRTRFKEQSQKLVEQFSHIEYLPETFIDGKLTLSENIADIGGLAIAFDALEMYLKDNPVDEKINEMTQQERFFVAWTVAWRAKLREEAVVTALKKDVHSPADIRGTQVPKNLDMFHDAFGTEEGDGMWMNKDDRVTIW